MTDLDLDRLRALADAATPGPWVDYNERADLDDDIRPMWVVGQMDESGVNWIRDIADVGGDDQDADAAFIAAARTAVPALLDRLTAAEEEVERLRAERDRRPSYDRRYGVIANRIRAVEEKHAAANHSAHGCDLCSLIQWAHDLEAIIDAECMSGGEWSILTNRLTAERDAAQADLARFRAALTDPAAVEAMRAARHEHTAESAGIRVVNCVCGQQLPGRDEFDRHQEAAALRAFAAFVDEEAGR